MTTEKLKWQCPWCDHYLEFNPEDSKVVALAMFSHIRRRHAISLE